MKALFQKLSPEWILRLTLGVMYLYSGIDLVRHPTAWYWAIRPLPDAIQTVIQFVGMDHFLVMQGIVELIFAAVLIVWFVPKIFVNIVALFTAIEMAAILLLVGIDGVTFRDIAILGSALALFIIRLRKI